MLISIVSIFVYLFWMYTALRCLPHFQWPTLLIALMPTAFWYGISLSADSFIIVISLLFFGWCMKLRETDRAYTTGELATLAILALLMSQCKFVYFPVLAIMFLLPAGNFKSRRHYWCFTVTVIVASVFLGGLWNKLASDQAALLNLDGRSTQEKMLFILVHPWQFAVDLWQVIAATWLPTLKSAVQQLSFVAAPGHPDFWIVYFLVFFSYFFVAREKSLNLSWRVLFLVIFLGTVGMIYAAIFCVNMLHIIQGRYLIPLVPLLFLVFGQNKFGLPEKYLPYYKGFLVIFLAAVHLVIADELFQIYWI